MLLLRKEANTRKGCKYENYRVYQKRKGKAPGENTERAPGVSLGLLQMAHPRGGFGHRLTGAGRYQHSQPEGNRFLRHYAQLQNRHQGRRFFEWLL